VGLDVAIEGRAQLPLREEDSNYQQPHCQQGLGEHDDQDQPALDRVLSPAQCCHACPLYSILQNVTLAAESVN
jgi:hypothetical protein